MTSSPRRGPARSDAILRAVVELVGEIGYGQVTTDAIAARAQASKTTIYRNWPTKAALLAEALRRQSEGPRPDAADTGSLRSDLLATVDGIVTSLTGGQPLSLLNLTDAIHADPELRDLVARQIRERGAADGTAVARRAADRGEIGSPRRGPAAVELIFSHLFTATLLDGRPPARPDREWFVDAVLLPFLGAGDGAGEAKGDAT